MEKYTDDDSGDGDESNYDELFDERSMNSEKSDYVKWLVKENRYYPSSDIKFTDQIPAGYYKIDYDNKLESYYFLHIDFKTDKLYKLPINAFDNVITDIKKFWEREDKFNEYNLIHKRGILLYGPAGNGKTSLIQLIVELLINSGDGVIFSIKDTDDLENFIGATRNCFKVIQPNTKIIVMLEDIDGLIEDGKRIETQLLNLLDGIDHMNNIVYIATTNYPELLKERFLNRPSRFDGRYYLGLPNEEVRKYYLENILSEEDLKKIDLNFWVKETKNLSIAHLRDLVVSVVILENDFEKTIKTYREYSNEFISSDKFEKIGDDGERKVGFK